MTDEITFPPSEDAAPCDEKEESTQRRRELRDSEATGTVTIEGEDFPLRDWSSSGFSITDCKREFKRNARVDIDFSVQHSEGSLGFACKAIIVRRDENSGEVAGAFVEMAREDRVAVAAYFDALEEG